MKFGLAGLFTLLALSACKAPEQGPIPPPTGAKTVQVDTRCGTPGCIIERF